MPSFNALLHPESTSDEHCFIDESQRLRAGFAGVSNGVWGAQPRRPTPVLALRVHEERGGAGAALKDHFEPCGR
jgi:hypothetical protein